MTSRQRRPLSGERGLIPPTSQICLHKAFGRLSEVAAPDANPLVHALLVADAHHDAAERRANRTLHRPSDDKRNGCHQTHPKQPTPGASPTLAPRVPRTMRGAGRGAKVVKALKVVYIRKRCLHLFSHNNFSLCYGKSIFMVSFFFNYKFVKKRHQFTRNFYRIHHQPITFIVF